MCSGARMVHIRDMTIRYKLISIIMAACVASLVMAGAAFVGWEWHSLRQTLVRNLSTQAQIIAANSMAALAFEDAKDAEQTLEALKAEPSIVFGCVYGADGKPFASYYRSGVDASDIQVSAPGKSGYSLDDKFVTVFEAIVLDGEATGMVCLRSDLEPLRAILKRDTITIVIVLLFISGVAYIISSGLQGIISSPILRLASVARVVSEKKEYSVRAVKRSEDEVGTLIDAFNEMLEQIQQRDAALVNVNTELEERVEERTAELKEEVMVRKQAEDVLAGMVRQLTRTHKELREFTRISAHDLKTPLRAIGTLSDWIAEDCAKKSDEQGKEMAGLLAGRARRMSNLLDAVMRYTDISTVEPAEEEVDLGKLVKDVISEIIPPDENIEITFDNELPVVVGDRKLLAQVFRNLLDNAVKYNDKPQGRISIGCVGSDEFWQFHVSDNGPGIEKRYFEKIFGIFQMLSRRDDTEDVGIGLSIVKKIVEMYEGRVWVASEPGKGSTFFFTWPKQSRRAGGRERSLNTTDVSA